MKSPLQILYRLPRFSGFLLKKPGISVTAARHLGNARLLGRPQIRAIEYAVTYRCQASCSKCSAVRMHDASRPLLTRDQERRLADDCHRLGAYEVNLTGGEPLLRDDLEEVAALFHPRFTFIGVNTNGQLLDRRRILSLRDAGVDLLKISLDSPVAEEHDRSRGLPGLYRHVVEVLRLVRGVRGIRGHLCMVTTRQAVERGQVQQVLDLCKEHDATLGLVLPAAIGGWSRNHEVLLDPAQRRSLDRFSGDPSVFLQGNVGSGRFACPCGTEEIYISCYGDVIPCPFIQIAFGNVREQPFSEIYRRMARWKKRETRAPVCSSAEDPRFRARYVDPLHRFHHTPVPFQDHPAWRRP